MKAQCTETNEWVFFIGKCLPFGSSISCALFQNFSDALCFLIETKVNMPRQIMNYLDDFLFIARTLALCNFMIQSFLDLCVELGVPIATEKTERASDLTLFLRILLDGRNLLLIIPEEKRQFAIQLLLEMCDRRKATVKDLQKLCGYLNFL